MAKMKTFWTCPNCHEQVEDHLEACWNCQHNRHGVLVEDLSSSEERHSRTTFGNCQTLKDVNLIGNPLSSLSDQPGLI